MKTLDLRFKHPFSCKTGREKITVSVYRLEKNQNGEAIDGIVDSIFKIALSGVQELLAKEMEKYTQKYKGNLGIIDFNGDQKLNYDGILN